MTPGELAALRDIRGYAAANRVTYSPHARQRVRQRCEGRVEHVRHALANATACAALEAERWKATGLDLDGDELSVVVAIEDGVIVVTLF